MNEIAPIRTIGGYVPMVDGPEKVSGRAKYTADILQPGMLAGRIYRSPYAHAEIIEVDVSEAARLPGVLAVVTGADCDKPFGVLPIARSEYPLARGKVRYKGEPVAAVAAVDEATADKAVRLIKMRVRELPFSAWQSAAAALTGQFNSSDSSATIAAVAIFPAVPLASYAFEVTAEIGAFADHPLLDASTASTTGWFVRNQWYRLPYCAIAPPHPESAAVSRACTPAPLTCLDVANLAPAAKQRAILILAGRVLAGQARPSANVADFLEFGNAANPGGFERQPVSTAIAPALKKPFNDRIIVVDANP